MVGPERRVPSGNITTGSPAATSSRHWVSASRSAPSRLIGNPPSDEKNQSGPAYFQRESLPMNRIRRRVTNETTKVSMFERWAPGARMKAPVAGMFSRPWTSMRNMILPDAQMRLHTNR